MAHRAQTLTTGVRIRPLPVEDAHQLLAGQRPPATDVTLHPDYPMSETLDAVAMTLAAHEAMGGAAPDPPRWWVHQILVDQTVVGDIAFHGPPGPGLPVSVEIGYAVVSSWRGRGVATRACRLILARAWADGADRVIAEAEATNPASQRVLFAAGFRTEPDGRYAIDRPGP